ncbi:hypothetical protein ACFLS9_05925 [Bacteroidota bacterium]
MQYLLDILGASIIGMFVIFMIVQFNMQMSEANQELIMNNMSQFSTVTSSEIIEYDFYKIGYRVGTSNKFLVAKSNEVEYFADINNDGSRDSVRYYIGDRQRIYEEIEMETSQNPYNRPIYRSVNGGKGELISIVRKFEITYLDSMGVKIPENLLINPSKRREIRGLGVYVLTEASEKTGGIYQGTEWRKTIWPKNVN